MKSLYVFPLVRKDSAIIRIVFNRTRFSERKKTISFQSQTDFSEATGVIAFGVSTHSAIFLLRATFPSAGNF